MSTPPEVDPGLKFLHQPFQVSRSIYATITIMSALVIYAGRKNLTLIGVAYVVILPMWAIFLVQVFSASKAQRIETQRPLRGEEWGQIIRIRAPLVLICVPVLALVSILEGVGISLADSIQITLWLGALTLGLWGLLAARRAGFAGWRLVVSAAAGLSIGGVILLLQVFLQRG